MARAQRTAAERIGWWFICGSIGWLVIGPIALLLGFVDGSWPGMILGGLVVLVGWSAMLVAIIGKGVELGVRAANNQ